MITGRQCWRGIQANARQNQGHQEEQNEENAGWVCRARNLDGEISFSRRAQSKPEHPNMALPRSKRFVTPKQDGPDAVALRVGATGGTRPSATRSRRSATLDHLGARSCQLCKALHFPPNPLSDADSDRL